MHSYRHQAYFRVRAFFLFISLGLGFSSLHAQQTANTDPVLQRAAIDVDAAYKQIGQGNAKAAITLLIAAQKVFRERLPSEHPIHNRVLGDLGTAYLFESQHEQALAVQRELVAKLRQRLGDDAQEVVDQTMLLSERLADVGENAEATRLREEILRKTRAKYGDADERVLVIQNSLAVHYGQVGSDQKALDAFEAVYRANLAKHGKAHRNTLFAMNNLVSNYSRHGRLTEELAMREDLVAIAKTVLSENNEDLLIYKSNLAYSYAATGKSDAEAVLSNEVVNSRRARWQQMQREFGVNDHRTAFGAVELAYSLLAAKRDEEALGQWRVIYQNQVANAGGLGSDAIEAQLNIALMLNRLGRREEGIKNLETVVAWRRSNLGERNRATVQAMQYLSEAYARSKRFPEALILDESLLRSNSVVYGPSHQQTLQKLNALSVSYANLGRLADIPPLAREFSLGVEASRLQAGLAGADRQNQFTGYAAMYARFGRNLGLLANRGPSNPVSTGLLSEGFEYADRSKARTLIESMAQQRAMQSAGLAPIELEQLRRIASRATSVEQRIANNQAQSNPNADTVLQLQTQREDLNRQLKALQDDIKRRNPKYGQLQEVKLVKAKDAAQLLESDQVFISYTLEPSNGNLSAWILTNTGVPMLVDLGPQKTLNTTIATFRDLLSGKRRNLAAQELAVRQQLSDILIKPLLAPELGLGERKRWIVCPDGDLALLPFDSLLATADKRIVERHELSLVQSFSVYALLKEREAQYKNLVRSRSLFAMGNAVYDPGTYRASVETRGQARSFSERKESGLEQSDVRPGYLAEQNVLRSLQWTNLPGTGREIQAVSKVFGARADSLVGERATEDALKTLSESGRLSDYRYVLFSAHGYLSANPSLSSLVLSQHATNEQSDGYITALEWPSYNLKSDLMVLSACDTGVGKILPGEGVMGLPYALFVAGNRNTLLTLWPVDDDATAEFMTRFFTRLQAGDTQVGALAAVKREFALIPKWAAPKYWAAFVLYGV